MSPAPANAGTTLDEVRARGFVRCGVTELGESLTTLNASGRWVGFYTDFCRAVAAAVTGDAKNVEFVMVSTGVRFDALRASAMDLLSEASTWTMTRDVAGLEFAAVTFHDGQAFMVYAPDGITSVDQLKGKTVCVPDLGTSPQNLRDFAREKNLGIVPLPFATIEGAFQAFFDRQCKAISTDSLILGSVRLSLAPDPAQYRMLDARISHEPLGLVVRDNDVAWADIVRWTFFAMVRAEELGITSQNADDMRRSGVIEVRRLLGIEEPVAKEFGLDPEWGYRVVKQVGNYAEVYDRALGPKTAFGMARGRNALVKNGGVLWAPPIR
ncbi:MAG: amino acid ABC transporter substrate-binding protein [Rhodospirillales bacterium]|nr:amino acid ABC transporter substrate-binding protein [Rhodospirillales bacterium]